MLTFPSSGPIHICPYNPRWPEDFAMLQSQLRALLGDLALRIDHIGSTSVPGLAAKDIIDIQITVAHLQAPELVSCLHNLPAGFTLRPHLRDELTGLPADSPELNKHFIKATAPQRSANIHIREYQRLNQRYALLFRDFLRHNPKPCALYGLLKQRLARLFPDSIDGYLFIKDPLMDLLYNQAETWAKQTQWELPSA